MNKLIPFIISLLFSISISAQNFDITWQQCYGGSKTDGRNGRTRIEKVEDGYVVLTNTKSDDGDVVNYHGGDDLWLFKIDFDGIIMWSNCLGGSELDHPSQLIKASDGGFYVFGEAGSTDGDVTGNHGDLDFWMVKTNDIGQIERQKCYGGIGQESMSNTIKLANDNLVMFGCSSSADGDISNNFGFFDAWIIEVNSAGDVVWEKSFGGSSADSFGGIIETSDNGLLLCGRTNSSDGLVECDNTQNNAWLIKLDTDRNIEWQQCYGGTYYEGFGPLTEVDDGYIIAGLSNSNDGDVTGHHGVAGDNKNDVWVVKTDFDGSIMWQRSLGGCIEERVYKIIPSDNGYIFLCSSESHDGDVSGNHSGASSYYDIWLVKLNLSGELMWQKCIGGYLNQEAHDAIVIGDKLFLAGSTGKAHPDDDVTCDFGGIGANIWLLEVEMDDVLVPQNNAPEDKLEIYPNPANNYVYFKYDFKTGTNRNLVIRNIFGEVVHKEVLHEQAGTNTWFSENLPSGIYFYSIVDEKEVISGKVVLVE